MTDATTSTVTLDSNRSSVTDEFPGLRVSQRGKPVLIM
jgi:hypothetical protein